MAAREPGQRGGGLRASDWMAWLQCSSRALAGRKERKRLKRATLTSKCVRNYNERLSASHMAELEEQDHDPSWMA